MDDQKIDDDTKQMLAEIGQDVPETQQEPIQDGGHLLEEHSETENDAPLQDSSTPSQQIENEQLEAKKKHRFSPRVLALLALLGVLLLGVALYVMIFKEDPSEMQANQQQSETESIQRFGIAVGMLEGVVEYTNDDTTWQPLTDSVDLQEGDSVKTADGARVVLLIDDGSAIRLDSATEINLKSLATNDVRIDNIKGQVYTRVVASESRKFAVYSDGELYSAKGTAYRTISTDTEKGMQVFHSKVNVSSKQTEVSEGNAYFVKSATKEKEGTVSAIDIEALKNDTFIKWNAEQDKAEQAFADKLGVLIDLDKPVEVAQETKTTVTTTTKAGITLKGSQSDYSAVFSWTITGVDSSGGFKLVRSATSKTPTYPDNSVVYIEKGKSSYTYTDKDGGTYYYRICTYHDGACDTYSNAVSVTTNAKPKPEVSSGTITLTLSGTTASWSDTGKAGNGYKLVMGVAPSPVYPGAEIAKYLTETTKTLPDGLTSGSTYYVRVCRYTYESTCTDYSNEVMYLAP